MNIARKQMQRIIKEELEAVMAEEEGKKDACYHKVKSRYDVWPSAYASGALVKCRKVGAKNWGNSKKEGLEEEFQKHDMYDPESGKKYDADKEQDHDEEEGRLREEGEPEHERARRDRCEDREVDMPPMGDELDRVNVWRRCPVNHWWAASACVGGAVLAVHKAHWAA